MADGLLPRRMAAHHRNRKINFRQALTFLRDHLSGPSLHHPSKPKSGLPGAPARSGFRLRAPASLTPAKRLNLHSLGIDTIPLPIPLLDNTTASQRFSRLSAAPAGLAFFTPLNPALARRANSNAALSGCGFYSVASGQPDRAQWRSLSPPVASRPTACESTHGQLPDMRARYRQCESLPPGG